MQDMEGYQELLEDGATALRRKANPGGHGVAA